MIPAVISQKIQVEATEIEKDGKRFFCKYSDVPTNDEGWVTDLKYFPISFDLVQLDIQNVPKILTGWWNGKKWVGLRVKENACINAWKRIINYEYYTV